MVARTAKNYWSALSKRKAQHALSMRQLRWLMSPLWRSRMPSIRPLSQTMPLKSHRRWWRQQSRRTISKSRSFRTIRRSASESSWSLLSTSLMPFHWVQLCQLKKKWVLAYGKRTLLRLIYWAQRTIRRILTFFRQLKLQRLRLPATRWSSMTTRLVARAQYLLRR